MIEFRPELAVDAKWKLTLKGAHILLASRYGSKNLCPSVFKLLKPLQMQGFLNGWTATVSGTASNAASAKTTRHYWPKTAETSPQRAFTSAVLRDKPDCWENPPLDRYLDGMAAWPEDSGKKHNQPPSWDLIVEMLEAAKIYE